MYIKITNRVPIKDKYYISKSFFPSELRYRPDQPRDEHGRWVSEGGSSADLTEGGDGGILSEEKQGTAGNDVHYVGKIDLNKYKCITPDIVTDDVIITEKQVIHIKKNHPNDYERFGEFLNEIVRDPDYIIEANKPKSALILKKVESNNEQFKAVLRLATSTDNPEYKNSIITFMKIDDREWNRLIKNKKVLYKSE